MAKTQEKIEKNKWPNYNIILNERDEKNESR